MSPATPRRHLRDLPRRLHALVALALFLFGTHVCVFAPLPSLAANLPTAAVSEGASHGCCGAAKEQAAREAESTRRATAPCCVAVSPVLAAHGASVDPAQVAVTFLALAPFDLPGILTTLDRPVPTEDARPPGRCSATPDAGRAPPRL